MEIYEETQRALISYAEHLEKLTIESKPDRLLESVKKFIAARILGKSLHSATDIAVEQNLNLTIQGNIRKICEVPNSESFSKQIEHLVSLCTADQNSDVNFQTILDIIKDLDLDSEIPEEILFNAFNEGSESASASSQLLPKARGRPKKQIVLANTEQIAKEMIKAKAKEVNIVFITLMRVIMTNLAQYFGGATGRILLRGKSSEETSVINDDENEPKHKSKKIKLEHSLSTKTVSLSPLNLPESKRVDVKLVRNLLLAFQTWQFLDHGEANIKKLLDKFNETCKISSTVWFQRFMIDGYLVTLSNKEGLDKIKGLRQQVDELVDRDDGNLRILEIRYLAQLLSAEVAFGSAIEKFHIINDLLSKMRECNLLVSDVSYLNGESMDEYVINLQVEEQLNINLLFFDSLSIIRYCISILMDKLKQYITSGSNVSETALGHTIALSQFDWPKKANIYKQCIRWIKDNKPTSTTPQCLSDSTKFTYPEFFHYIKNPHMIEDFMALLCQGYTLDIKSHGNLGSSHSAGSTSSSTRGASGGTSTRSGKAITTRGTNKTFKEDLKVAMVSQMRNSSFLLPLDLNAELIQSSLIPYLIQSKKRPI